MFESGRRHTIIMRDQDNPQRENFLRGTVLEFNFPDLTIRLDSGEVRTIDTNSPEFIRAEPH
jgi:hypothetical protein